MMHSTTIAIIILSSTSVVLSQFKETPDWDELVQKEIPEACVPKKDFESYIHEFSHCFQENIQKFEQNFHFGSMNEACKYDLVNCFDDLANKFRHCLSNKKYTEIFYHPSVALRGAQTYLCSNDGQPLQDIRDRVIPCMRDDDALGVKLRVQTCMDSTGERMRYLQIFANEDDCRELITLSMCLMDAFDLCDDKASIELARNVSLNMLNKTPCAKFTGELVEYIPSPPPTSQEITDSTASIHSYTLIPLIAIFLLSITGSNLI